MTDIAEASEMANEVSDEIVVQIRASQVQICMQPRHLVSDERGERERALTATVGAVQPGDGVEVHELFVRYAVMETSHEVVHALF
jgi:hypothetical protein